MARLPRYALAFLGPASSALAQFVISLILLHMLPADAFGGFSLLFIAAQFSWGIWSALFCAPLPVLMAEASGAAGLHRTNDRSTALAALKINGLAAPLVGLIFFVIAYLLGLGRGAALLFCCFVIFSLWRWFARSYAYASGRQSDTVVSDLVYSLFLLGGGALLYLRWNAPLVVASGALALGSLAGLLVFGPAYLAAQFGRSGSLREDWRSYCRIWRQHSGWSLLGVLTTETTANAHSYVVTLLLGPGAFAVVAASVLFTRPISVVLNALNEFERAQMAREIAAGDAAALHGSMRFFRAILGICWTGTVGLIVALFVAAPHLIVPPAYDLRAIELGAALWMIVIAVRILRAPESAMMQGGGAFRPLAFASVYSAGVSVVAAFLMVLEFGPVWSIIGIFAGELVFAVHLWLQARRWRNVHMPDLAVQAQ